MTRTIALCAFLLTSSVAVADDAAPAPAAPTLAPAPAPDPGWSRRKKLLVAGAVSFGVAALGASYWAYAHTGPIRSYRDRLDRGEGAVSADDPDDKLDSDDCGEHAGGDPATAASFASACRAYNIVRYVAPVTLLAAVAGTVLVIGGLASSEKPRAGDVAIAPAVTATSAGASLSVVW